MKTILFIANAVSAVLLAASILSGSSITGFSVAQADAGPGINAPLGMSIVFIITTISLDVYFYMRGRIRS